MSRPDGYYAWTATVGEKGQIVIPKQARDLFQIKPGDTLLILGDQNQGLAIPPKGAFADIFKVAFPENGSGEQTVFADAASAVKENKTVPKNSKNKK